MNQKDKLEGYADLLIDLTLTLYTDKKVNDQNKITYYQTALDHVARCLYGIKNNLEVKDLVNIGTKIEIIKETRKDVH